MKNIVRDVAAVSKTVILISIILVVVVVGVLAYIYWPHERSPSATTFYDETNMVASFTTNEDGGIIESTGSDGTLYALEIPEDAFWDENGENITLTPMMDFTDLPSDASFVAGVRLGPDGLRLFKPVTLTMKLPTITSPEKLLGVCYNGPAGEYYMVPLFSFEQSTSTATFQIMHFSDYIISEAQECLAEWSNPMFSEDIYKNKLACLTKLQLGTGKWPPVGSFTILRDWWNELVYLELLGATDLNSLELALKRYLEWRVHVDMFDQVAELAYCWPIANTEIQRVLENEISRLNNEAEGTQDLCEKQDKLDEFLKWSTRAQMLLYEYEVLIDIPDAHAFSDNLVEWLVQSVTIYSGKEKITVDEQLTLTAVFKNMANLPISNVDNVEWLSSDNGIVGIVNKGVETATIKGISPGKAAITAKAGCDAKDQITIEVIEEPTEEPEETKEPEEPKEEWRIVSVELTPNKATIPVGGTLTLTVSIKDNYGNEVPECPRLWHISGPIVWADGKQDDDWFITTRTIRAVGRNDEVTWIYGEVIRPRPFQAVTVLVTEVGEQLGDALILEID